MNITLLIRALTPGGAERQLVNLAIGLTQRGHSVDVTVFYRAGTPLEQELVQAGVSLVDLGKRSRWNLVGPMWRLLRHVRFRKVDVIYSFLPTANVVAAVLWSWRGSPGVVAGFRGSDTVRASHDWLGQWLVQLENRLARGCAAAIVNSESGATFRRRQGWHDQRLHVIRNSVRVEDFAFDPAARSCLRSQWNAGEDERVLGFAGRLDPVKGLDVLLRALARLPGRRLVVAGSGSASCEATLRARATELGVAGRVTWLGTRNDMPAFYSAVDLLVLPSLTEGCSNVLAEALAAGTPAVATAVGDAAWLLGEEVALARPGDADDLVMKLSAALEATPPARTALVARARQLLAADAMLLATERVLAGACGEPLEVAGRHNKAPDVMFVTMVFPWPSEAFAGVEVRALRACGARVRVRALRGRHARATELLQDWGVADMDATSTSVAAVLAGMAFGMRHPRITAEALGWLTARSWRRPVLAARCLLLVPRMLHLLAECRQSPPDTLYLFWGHYPALLGHLVLRWLPQVHVSQSLGAYDLMYRFPPSVDLGRRAHSLWTTTPSNLPALAAQGIDPQRVRIAAHALDLTQVPAAPGARDPAHFVTVARLEENKGVDDVLRATAAVRATGRAIRLTVIGEGPYRERLVALAGSLGIADAVTFTGGIPHSAVWEQLSRAGLFLLLSRSPAERLPNAVKEALACGCLCVVTQTTGIEELVAPLARPMIVAQGDWRAAAAFAQSVLDHPERFAGDGERGREHMLRNYDARAVARERISAWSALSTVGRAA